MLEVLPWYILVGLGEEGAGAGVSPGLLRVRRLRASAVHGGAVRVTRRQGTLQATLLGNS